LPLILAQQWHRVLALPHAVLHLLAGPTPQRGLFALLVAGKSFGLGELGLDTPLLLLSLLVDLREAKGLQLLLEEKSLLLLRALFLPKPLLLLLQEVLKVSLLELLGGAAALLLLRR